MGQNRLTALYRATTSPVDHIGRPAAVAPDVSAAVIVAADPIVVAADPVVIANTIVATEAPTGVAAAIAAYLAELADVIRTHVMHVCQIVYRLYAAISIRHAWPHHAEKYTVMACGARAIVQGQLRDSFPPFFGGEK